MPKLLRFLALSGAMGLAIGLAVAAGLVYSDVAGLAMLFSTTQTPIIAGLIYFGSFALTFASLAMGSAIMLLPKDRDGWERE